MRVTTRDHSFQDLYTSESKRIVEPPVQSSGASSSSTDGEDRNEFNLPSTSQIEDKSLSETLSDLDNEIIYSDVSNLIE